MRETNPKLIGAFVIGGAVLLVMSLVLFSSQDLFVKKRVFVAYFQQSVNGLSNGAPVRFRGIPVGKVVDIQGVYEPETGRMLPRLVLELQPEVMVNAQVAEDEYSLLPTLLENGLRASLKSSSLLTGQLYVALDFRPQEPERYLGSGNDTYPELPTIDSGLDKALDTLSDLPFEELIYKLSSLLSTAEQLLQNSDIEESLAVLPKFLVDADSAVVDLRQFINRDLADTAQQANQTMMVARTSIQSLAETIDEETLVQLNSALSELENTLRLARSHLDSNTPLMHEVQAAAREIRSAARSIRDLADTLEKQPEALIKGKQPK